MNRPSPAPFEVLEAAADELGVPALLDQLDRKDAHSTKSSTLRLMHAARNRQRRPQSGHVNCSMQPATSGAKLAIAGGYDRRCDRSFLVNPLALLGPAVEGYKSLLSPIARRSERRAIALQL